MNNYIIKKVLLLFLLQINQINCKINLIKNILEFLVWSFITRWRKCSVTTTPNCVCCETTLLLVFSVKYTVWYKIVTQLGMPSDFNFNVPGQKDINDE